MPMRCRVGGVWSGWCVTGCVGARMLLVVVVVVVMMMVLVGWFWGGAGVLANRYGLQVMFQVRFSWREYLLDPPHPIPLPSLFPLACAQSHSRTRTISLTRSLTHPPIRTSLPHSPPSRPSLGTHHKPPPASLPPSHARSCLAPSPQHTRFRPALQGPDLQESPTVAEAEGWVGVGWGGGGGRGSVGLALTGRLVESTRPCTPRLPSPA